jgi:hypothetical protein
MAVAGIGAGCLASNREQRGSEFRETLLGLASLWNGQTTAAEDGQSDPTLGSGSQSKDAISPAVQLDLESSQVDRSVRGSGGPEKPDSDGTE